MHKMKKLIIIFVLCILNVNILLGETTNENSHNKQTDTINLNAQNSTLNNQTDTTYKADLEVLRKEFDNQYSSLNERIKIFFKGCAVALIFFVFVFIYILIKLYSKNRLIRDLEYDENVKNIIKSKISVQDSNISSRNIEKHLDEYIRRNSFKDYIKSITNISNNQYHFADRVSSSFSVDEKTEQTNNQASVKYYAKDTTTNFFDRILPNFKQGYSLFEIVVPNGSDTGEFTVFKDEATMKRAIIHRDLMLETVCDIVEIRNVSPTKILTSIPGKVRQLDSERWAIIQKAQIILE